MRRTVTVAAPALGLLALLAPASRANPPDPKPPKDPLDLAEKVCKEKKPDQKDVKRSFVVPHILETSGRAQNTPNTFDTSFFMTYSAGIVDNSNCNGADVDLYLMDERGLPMKSAVGHAICNPCTFGFNAIHRKESVALDDLFSASGGLARGTQLGFALITVRNDADHVSIQGMVTQSRSAPGDLSVFFFEPQPLRGP